MANWRETVALLLRGVHWAQAEWGGKWTQLLAGYHDVASQSAGEAVAASWILEESSPNDALQYAGINRNMERYPYETDDQYRARLAGAWAAWQLAGTRQVLIDQFAALGITIEVYSHAEWTRPPVNHPVTGTLWWSKFTVFIADPTGWAPPVDWDDVGPTWDDGVTMWDVTGDINLVSAMRGIIKKWKAGHEVCLEIIISDGPVFGSGWLFGDGTTFGGEQIIISAV